MRLSHPFQVTITVVPSRSSSREVRSLDVCPSETATPLNYAGIKRSFTRNKWNEWTNSNFNPSLLDLPQENMTARHRSKISESECILRRRIRRLPSCMRFMHLDDAWISYMKVKSHCHDGSRVGLSATTRLKHFRYKISFILVLGAPCKDESATISLFVTCAAMPWLVI